LNQIASKRKFIKKNESYTGTVHFHCDLSERANPFPHFWEHAVGGDHGQWLCAQTTSRSSGEASCENGPRTSIGSRQDDRSFTPNGILHLIRAIRFDEPYAAAFVIKTVMEASGLEFTPGAHR
jgi:hypothetical protein